MFKWLSSNAFFTTETRAESHFPHEVLSYLEILAATVTGELPTLAIGRMRSEHSLQTSKSVTGVEAWLLKCVIRIIQLRTWKIEQISRASLSMLELMRRSTTIEDDLKRHSLNTLAADQDHHDARAAFMTVFQTATAVFLQCTISDPRPEIVEIQSEVSRTTTALKNLPYAALLKRLAWPVGVAAAMALEGEQQRFYRNLHEQLRSMWGPEENVCRALRCALECWRLRNGGSPGRCYDWIDGMKSLGYMWLLF